VKNLREMLEEHMTSDIGLDFMPSFPNDMVIYCSHCQMWFDCKNGWYARRDIHGMPRCPACGAGLFEISAKRFYENNRNSGRLEEVMTWEWPGGAFWKKDSEG
jgi:hypothetical protein